MNFSASSSVLTLDQSSRSGGVRKYASGDFAQSLYLESWAITSEASARPARANNVFFTKPPRVIERRILSKLEHSKPCSRVEGPRAARPVIPELDGAARKDESRSFADPVLSEAKSSEPALSWTVLLERMR